MNIPVRHWVGACVVSVALWAVIIGSGMAVAAVADAVLTAVFR